jgi:hypothetical protein
MKMLSGTAFGGSRQMLTLFYTAYIESLIDYGLPIYASTAPHLLAQRDVVTSSSVCLIIGAWRSSALPALYCEANIMPPDLHRQELQARFLAQLFNKPPLHPAHAK